ncbi:MAG: hypothetical protein P8R43_05135 [Planctomycetota bacterium]|nr:hypothetical protein [Planctomycetota bacterium]
MDDRAARGLGMISPVLTSWRATASLRLFMDFVTVSSCRSGLMDGPWSSSPSRLQSAVPHQTVQLSVPTRPNTSRALLGQASVAPLRQDLRQLQQQV